eukprot:CAMPEP_0181296710 /NCGR_PEP_ID=MMETSP1101-20121128/4849_1 /TAXON_ID=46948 /ORGANISM="Rhodomonas abbreviata, Strain Caron Lab Isolate" /LENGTH=560 /DNA_ID=CAMNT_0023401593 /DNA_START=18 /DNA_END=1700 /DNA_ORIENTATION=-
MSKKGVKKPEKGLSFPITNDKGDRSTSVVGKNIIAAAMRGAGTPEGEKFAVACEKEKNWRFKYNKHYMNLVRLSAASPDIALKVAGAGADYMHDTFEFVDPNDSTSVTPFSQFMDNAKSRGSFQSHTIEGTGGKKGGKPLSVPYKRHVLRGEALKAQLARWAEYGTIEPDAAQALSELAEGDLDLAGRHFVLIGAGSAMGPFIKLLEHGATVICIDIPGAWGEGPKKMWKRLIDTARNSPGKIIVPVTAAGGGKISTDDELLQAVGCNLTEQPAEILNWLSSVAPKQKLTVGNYTYLDGDLHVKLSLAADAVMKSLLERRPNTAIAFLCTPTDIHVIPDAAHQAAKSNYGFHLGKPVEILINLLSMGKMLRKNALAPVPTQSGTSLKLCDGMSVAQGPNYALAKRLQHWRAMLAYDGAHTVSSHIAPSTATASVVSNRSFGWAYGGMPYFKPYEIFQQETTNALMAGMLVADVVQKSSVADPKNRKYFGIKNTLELFKHNSVHGGLWRAAYKVDSIGETSVIIHFLGGPKNFLPMVFVVLVVIIFAVLKFTPLGAKFGLH